MAAPTWVQSNSGITDATGPWTITSAAPGAAGRILIVQVLQDGTNAGVPDITSVTNAEDLAGTDSVLTKIGQFDCGSAVAAFQHLWIGRSLSTSAMVVTGANSGGDDVYVQIHEFQDVSTGTTLATVIENSSAGGTVNSAGTGFPADDSVVVTLDADRLGINLAAINDDIAMASDSLPVGTWNKKASFVSSTGTDGSIALYTTPAATTGTYGGSETIGMGGIAGGWGVVGFALIGTTAGSGGTTYTKAGFATENRVA